MSIADVVVFDLLDKATDGGTFSVDGTDSLNNYEHLKALTERVKTSPGIKEYLETRPQL